MDPNPQGEVAGIWTKDNLKVFSENMEAGQDVPRESGHCDSFSNKQHCVSDTVLS